MSTPHVAYVMNGFPRLSETFIAHEIHQLERLGLPLRLFSVKRENEPAVHPVVAAIRAPLTYLPRASSLSGTSLGAWLAAQPASLLARHARVATAPPAALGDGAGHGGLGWPGRIAAATSMATCGCARSSSRSSCRPARSPPT